MTGVLMATLLVEACARKRPSNRSAAAPSAAAVEWAGCAAVTVGPRCELGPDRKLTIWTAWRAPTRQWAFAADERVHDRPEAQPMQDGWRMTFVVPDGARQVTATSPDEGAAVWTLAVEPTRAPSEIDRLADRRQGRRPRRGGAPARPRRPRADGAARPAQAGLGRVMLARGRWTRPSPPCAPP